MRIGIYGGTFNPPHLGHLVAAQAAVSQLELDRLLFIPAATPPHKQLPQGTPTQDHRLEMTRLMADGVGLPKVVEVSAMEMERQGESYTVDTLRQLREDHPDAQLWLLMGTDMFHTFHQWRNPQEILQLAAICAFGREQGDVDGFATQKEMLQSQFGGRVDTITIPNLVEVSSTQLRQRLAEGEGEDLLPTTVYGYILRHQLYGTHQEMVNLPEDKLRACSLSMVKGKRIPHILGTETTAVSLARHWGANEVDARRAAILHDCTKYWSLEEHLELCQQYGMVLDEMERGALKLLHAKSGSCMARHVFGENEEVCQAILYHTTAREHMTLLDKILYMADYMEPNRTFDGVEILRQLAYTDLDRAILVGVHMTITEMEERNNPIHKNTLEASQWLRQQGITES